MKRSRRPRQLVCVSAGVVARELNLAPLAIKNNQSALKDAVLRKISGEPVENFEEKMRKNG
jgi:hypothetical protein